MTSRVKQVQPQVCKLQLGLVDLLDPESHLTGGGVKMCKWWIRSSLNRTPRKGEVASYAYRSGKHLAQLMGPTANGGRPL